MEKQAEAGAATALTAINEGVAWRKGLDNYPFRLSQKEGRKEWVHGTGP